MSSSKYRSDKKPVLSFYERGPGPAAYKMSPLVGRKEHAPTHRINPEYSFGLKLPPSIFDRSIGPGAAGYGIRQGLKVNGYFAGYLQSLRPKFPEIDKRMVPPPNTYNLPPTNNYRNRAPTAVIGSRTPLINKRVGPGPNAYLLPPAIGPRIPDKLAAAECTIKGTRKNKELVPSPGPIYNPGSPDLIKSRGPAYTMRPKWKDIENLYDAGPASYTPEHCKCRVPPGPSMGIRYNEFTGIFRTGCEFSKYEPLDAM